MEETQKIVASYLSNTNNCKAQEPSYGFPPGNPGSTTENM